MKKERLTNADNNFLCRAKHCSAEKWMLEVTDTPYLYWRREACDNCPFMEIVNRLAEYEDMEEKMEDDLK